MMNKESVIILAEDDLGHATLIIKNLKRTGLTNPIVHFKDGQATLDFLFCKGPGPHRVRGTSYLVLLDIKMPRVDGVEVLRRIKQDIELRKIPVSMLTTTDEPQEIERCYSLGCSNYICKPTNYDSFVEAIMQLGLFLLVVEIPRINGERKG